MTETADPPYEATELEVIPGPRPVLETLQHLEFGEFLNRLRADRAGR